MTEPFSDDVRIRRVPERGNYDRSVMYEIADAGLVAHVATVREGQPIIIPMFCVRDGNNLLLHGAPAAGVLRRAGSGGTSICVEMTLLDGIVLARSSFHHSMNYRSLVALGTPEEITDPQEKSHALEMFVERIVPGRQADLRPTTQKELQGTAVFRLSLENASAKIRTGPPVDDEEDYELNIWAGVLPVHRNIGEPIPDPRNKQDLTPPTNVLGLVTPDVPM